jgi:hypothetical protein
MIASIYVFVHVCVHLYACMCARCRAASLHDFHCVSCNIRSGTYIHDTHAYTRTHAVRQFVCQMLKADGSQRPSANECEQFFAARIRSAGENKGVEAARHAAQVLGSTRMCVYDFTCMHVYLHAYVYVCTYYVYLVLLCVRKFMYIHSD